MMSERNENACISELPKRCKTPMSICKAPVVHEGNGPLVARITSVVSEDNTTNRKETIPNVVQSVTLNKSGNRGEGDNACKPFRALKDSLGAASTRDLSKIRKPSEDHVATCNEIGTDKDKTSCPSKVPVEIVYVASTNAGIPDRDLLFCAIPCMLKEKYSHGEVMSLRMDGLHKGIPGKHFPNSLIMDICHDGIKRHTKIFSTGNIQICGMPNETTFLDLVSVVYGILNDAEDYIAQHYGVNFDKLLSDSKGPEFMCINTFRLKGDKDLGTITLCKYVKETSIRWPDKDVNQDVDNLKKRCDDLLVDSNSPHGALKARIDRLTSSKRKPRVYKLRNFKLCSVVLKYNLGYVINRYALVSNLEERGYTTYFANATGYGVTVFVASEPPSGSSSPNKNGESLLPETSDSLEQFDQSEKLVFHLHGTIRHSGPSLDNMLKTKEKILTLLNTIENLIKLTI